MSQLNATANIPGAFVYTPPAGTVLSAGPAQTLNVTFTPTDIAHFNVVSASVKLNVLRATPVITWNNPADIVSGTALSATQLNATANVPGTFVYVPASGTVLGVGNGQALLANFTPTDSVNYNSATKTVFINVLPTSPWANQVVLNGGPMPSANSITASNNFLTAIAALRSRIYHIGFCAPDTLIAAYTPLIAAYTKALALDNGVGFNLWVKHAFGGGGVGAFGELQIFGLSSSVNDANGNVYDTGVNPSAIASFTTGNCGLSLYCSETTDHVGSTNGLLNRSANGLVGGYDGTSAFETLLYITGFNVDEYLAFDPSNIISVAGQLRPGYHAFNRTAANLVTAYFANNSNAFASVGTSVHNNVIAPMNSTVGAGGTIYPGPTYNPCSDIFSFMAVHDGFSAADEQTLYNAVVTLRNALGGGTF